MRTTLTFLFLAGCLTAEDLQTGFSLQSIQYQGPGEWLRSAEPIWVYAYPTIRLSYRASGLPKSDTPVLTLRPGSVGPVTPGATNPENPFVAGMPVTVIFARDLVADGAPHALEVDLTGKMRTPQIDQLRFSLPAGGRLSIDNLEFRGGTGLLPCAAGGPALPRDAEKLKIDGAVLCAGVPATPLRGKGTIQIHGNGRPGRTLYLSLYPHFASTGTMAANQPPEKARLKESTETTEVTVRLKYTDGFEEEQYPLSLQERRHVLVNGKAAIYALELDPHRTLASAELLDRGVHSQLLLFAAGISSQAAPASTESLPVTSRKANRPPAEPDLSASTWHKISAAAGRKVPGDAVRTEFKQSAGPDGRRLSLEVKNESAEAQEFTLTFPSVTIRPGGAAENVYYMFPRQGAVISHDDQKLEAAYNAAFPLQFVDVFAPHANSGTCLIVRDNIGYAKKFRVQKSGAEVVVEVDYLVRLAPGATYRPPEVQLTPHGGDWHEGFDAYRQWLASWYKPAGVRPAWLRTAFWARRDYPVGGTGLLFDVRRGRYTYDALIRDGRLFGGIDFIDISGWAMSEKLGRVGDYPVELGGAADLRRNVALGQKERIPTGLYFEGYLIDKNSKVGQRQAGEWQLIDAKGQGAWWKGGTPTELFVCPYVRDWQQYLSNRVAEVTRDTGVDAVYLDEFGFGGKRCYSSAHGHPPGEETLIGEIAMAKQVRRALDAAGRRNTMIYLEETPPDAAAPYFDAAFCYNFSKAIPRLSPLKLNLSRFAFPDIRLWDMVSTGIDPRVLSAEDFRLSLWHGNGLWLKGHSETWYGDDLLQFIRRARGILHKYADAFNGSADPLVESPHPAVFINRFHGGGSTVHTLFNASYRTVRFTFQGEERKLGPREVDVVAGN